MFGDNPAKAQLRNSSAIHGYIGPNGEGKSLAMVHDSMPGLDAGRPCLSSVPLLDWRAECGNCGAAGGCTELCPETDRPLHPLYVPLTSLSQLVDWRDGDVNLDEVQGIASSREHNSLPYQANNAIRKMRHADARIRWTAPDWMAADASIRRVTRAVTLCSGHAGVQHIKPCISCGRAHRRPDKVCPLRGEARLWLDNRVFRWRTFDARRFDEFTIGRTETASKRQRLKPMSRQLYIRSRGAAQWAYDTHGDVIELGSADMSGVCINCGGTRRRPTCSCADHQRSATRLPRPVRGGQLEPAGSPSGPRPAEPATTGTTTRGRHAL